MKLHHAASMPVLDKLVSSDSESDDSEIRNAHPSMARTESTVCFADFSDDESETMVPPHRGYKKVLVTGGAGFIGSHVAEYLLARGDDVVIVDEMNDYYDVKIKEGNLKLLRENYPDKRRLSIYRGDICDDEFMLQVFEQERPKWVCHMAARAGVRPSIQDPYVYIHSNIKGTTHLMELSHKFGVENFVFASSSSVYGGSESTFFSEDENVDNPVSPYAASKKACELLAYTYHHLYQLNVTGLRFFTVYGPRGRPDMAPFKFIDRVSRGLEIQQFGDGSSSRDYTYISDIVDGIVRAVDRPHKYEVFNLGKGDGTSLKEFIDLVQEHTGKKAIIKVMPDQPGDVPYTCANISKAYTLLGYKSKVPFDEGIRRTVKWYNEAYSQKAIEVCPESQANGLGRAPSFVELTSAATVSIFELFSVNGWTARPTDRKGFLETAGHAAAFGAGALLVPNQEAVAFTKDSIYEPAPKSLVGQVHVITGASSGSGLESAKRLAAAGATVVLTARTVSKGELAKTQVQEYLQGKGEDSGDVSFLTLDLEHFDSIRSFPKRFEKLMGEDSRINVLMNNAGLKVEKRALTEDGYERIFQSNHLGPFLLTALLFSKLDRQHGARIVNVSSQAHNLVVMANSTQKALDLTNLNGEKSFTGFGWSAYANSKLENILFTQELQRRADAAGLTWLTAVSLHPGVVGTDIWRETTVSKQNDNPFNAILSLAFYKTVLPIEEGANTQVLLASSPAIAKGEYYDENGRVQKLETYARDPVKAKQLWEASEKMVGIDFYVA